LIRPPPTAEPVNHHTPHFAQAPVGLAVHALLLAMAWATWAAPGNVNAQTAPSGWDTAGVGLKPSPALQENLPPEVRPQMPTFVSGDKVSGQTDGVVSVEGRAELRRHDTVIRADRLEFDQRSNEAKAQGEVLVNRNGNRFEGPELQLNVETNQGTFQKPTFSLLQSEGHGDASRVDFLDADRLSAYDARYSTCPRTPGAPWTPDWLIRASRVDLDNAKQEGTAVGGVLEFQGVPILGAPYLSFPLTNARKSGFLPPSINLDNVSGLEISQPYYLNLAPNIDATLFPTAMSKRGVDLAGELRYLQPRWSGQVRAAYMPSDQLREDNRWGYSVQHSQALTGAPALRVLGLDGVFAARLNLNRVSDDNYWRDFPRSSTSLTTRLLASEGALSWGRGPWSFSAGAYRWQTLQDIEAPIIPPYDRLPSLAARYVQRDFTLAGLRGWDTTLLTEYTRFRSERQLTGQANGARALAVAEISRRWETPGWYVKPRLQLHTTQYRFDTPLSDGSLSASRAVPTLSVDSGMVFERSASYFGRAFAQTLEPRAFFTTTPFRDQSRLPNYDSGANDFNFASIYSENVFVGNDRIADTRAVTLGASSRLLDPDTGAEVVRLGVAQRYRLRDQEVTLPGGTAQRERLSDVLLGARVQWDPRWQTDATVQFNPKTRKSSRTTLSARYAPSNFRVLNAAYRLQRGVSEQVDVGWQWPLADFTGTPAPSQGMPGRGLGAGRWYSVGRVNYSMPERKIVDLVAGFEYDAGCWIGRLVLERLQVGTSSANQRILFQLEFSGFSRLGSNPLQSLKANIPRYQYLREEINPPSRFQQYD
jgi:LPS-assembly protein